MSVSTPGRGYVRIHNDCSFSFEIVVAVASYDSVCYVFDRRPLHRVDALNPVRTTNSEPALKRQVKLRILEPKAPNVVERLGGRVVAYAIR